MTGGARNILLCLRFGIGDVVMELPAVDALARNAPGARLTVLGAAPATELLRGHPGVDHIAVVQDFGLQEWQDYGTPEIRRNVHRWLKEQQFDLVLDVSHAVAAVRYLLWETRPAEMLDSGLLNGPDPVLADGGSGQQALREHFRAGWGLDIPEIEQPRLRLTREEHLRAERYLRSLGISGPVAAVSPVGSSPLKRWPEERLAVVADEMISAGFRVVILGGSLMREAEDVRKRMRRPEGAVLLEPLNLRQTAALLARCSQLVANDTGLMHLAAAVETPVTAIFGPTAPELYLPREFTATAAAPRNFCVHRARTIFGPSTCITEGRCLLHPSGCIRDIRTDRVLELVRGNFKGLPEACHA